MAVSENPLLKNIRGAIHKQIVVKQFSHRTVVTKFPDMSRVVLSPLQKKGNKAFADAVKYARDILNDPEKYNTYKKALQPGQRVYNQAIKAYLENVNIQNIKPFHTEDERISRVFNTEDERISRVFNTNDE
jgi:hypothetical protein